MIYAAPTVKLIGKISSYKSVKNVDLPAPGLLCKYTCNSAVHHCTIF